jgi:hypothetical protein
MRRYRIGSSLAVSTLALVLGAQAALGAVPISEKGKIGTYTVADGSTAPGVACTYDAGGPGDQGNDLDIMEAKSPRAFARDRSSSRDRQTVGVRVLFQRSVNEGGTGGWVTAKATNLVKKTAYDDKAPIFGKKSWLVPFELGYHYRVLSVIRWYKPGTSSVVQGSTKLRYVYYRVLQGGPQGVEQDRCLPEP